MGSNFFASILLFILSCSKCLFERCRQIIHILLLYKGFDERSADISLIPSVASKSHDISEVIVNTSFFDLFRFLVLLSHKIYQLFFCLFKTLIWFIKLGLEFGLKAIFRRWIFRSESKHLIFNVFQWELVCLDLLFLLELYKFLYWLFKILIRWWKLGLDFGLK